MKLACLCLTICLCAFLKAFSQSVTLPKLSKYADTTPSYYLSLYDEYLELFDEYSYYKSSNPDSFKIDFSKYDLKGIKSNGEWKWLLISPKKYYNLNCNFLKTCDSIQWHWLSNTIIINDSTAFNLLKTKSSIAFKDTFDFDNTALIYNNIWVDCNGTFDYKILYDPIENVIFCKLITYYDGSRGMCPNESWILLSKPKPDAKIVVETLNLN